MDQIALKCATPPYLLTGLLAPTPSLPFPSPYLLRLHSHSPNASSYEAFSLYLPAPSSPPAPRIACTTSEWVRESPARYQGPGRIRWAESREVGVGLDKWDLQSGGAEGGLMRQPGLRSQRSREDGRGHLGRSLNARLRHPAPGLPFFGQPLHQRLLTISDALPLPLRPFLPLSQKAPFFARLGRARVAPLDLRASAMQEAFINGGASVGRWGTPGVAHPITCRRARSP